jgi:hypothetical protein
MMHQQRNSLAELILLFEEYREVLIPAAGGGATACKVHDLQEIGALAATLRLYAINLGNRAEAPHLAQSRHLKQVDKVISE